MEVSGEMGNVDIHTDKCVVLRGWEVSDVGGDEYRVCDAGTGEVLISFQHVVRRGYASVNGLMTRLEQLVNGEWAIAETLTTTVRDFIEALSDEQTTDAQRLEIMIQLETKFCPGCGMVLNGRVCHCRNDE